MKKFTLDDFMEVQEPVEPVPPRFKVEPAADFPQLGWLYPYLKGINGFIAGGAFKNIFEGKPVKDLDVFFNNHIAWRQAVKKLRKRKWVEAYSNDRVTAFIHPKSGIRVELIGSPPEKLEQEEQWDNEPAVVHGSPFDTIGRFDFTITKFVLYKHGDDWMVGYHEDFFKHLQLKRIVIDDELVKPMSSFERALRYTGYGYRLCRESKMLLIREIQRADRLVDEQLSASFYDGMD